MVDKRVQLKRIAHINYTHKDLSQTRTFLEDFGLTLADEINGKQYYRGYGDLPYIYVAEKVDDGRPLFKGAAFEAESRADLERAAALQGASPIEPLEGPGGGERVTVVDPFGMPFHVVFGQKLCETSVPAAEALPLNQGITDNRRKARPAGKFQRFDTSKPVPVHKLGHYVINVPDFARAKEFYNGLFNFTASDVMTMGPGGPEVAAFMHLDRGKEWVDHHSLFIQTSPPGMTEPSLHHSAYEVFDMDSEFRAHNELEAKGYKLAWGIGRHILGSQLFDYWHQTADGFNVEHYADGDLVNEDTPVGVHPIGAGPPREQDLSVWAPAFGDKFMTIAEASLVQRVV